MTHFPSWMLRGAWIPAFALVFLMGCSGQRMTALNDDPFFGAKASAPAGTAARSADRFDPRDDIGIPPADLGRSPAALTNASISIGTPRVAEMPKTKDAGSNTTQTGFESPAESETYEQLQQKLQSRGVIWQELKRDDRGEWSFSCGIPKPGGRGMEEFYKAKAMGENGLAAIRAVIAKIEAQQ